VGRARQALIEFGSQLGRALLALLLQFGAPIVALYLVLVVPPLFGCLGYSDRPGPGCYGLNARVGLAEFGQHATITLSYALFAARFVWPAAFLCTLLALLTKWRPRTQWVRSVLLGVLGFVGTGYLTAAAGWYFALSGTGLLVVAVVGGGVAACVVPRLIAPGQRSNKPLEPPVGFAARGSTPIR
jgi:hypothetical protein